MIDLKVKNISDNPLPSYETIMSAGVDLRAFLKEDIVLKPMERKLIPTGLFFEIPEGFEGQIRPRSGLAIKNGISLINCTGTIDSDYRGEIKVPLVNFSNEDFIIRSGERIAQFILNKFEKINFVVTDKLSETKRGVKGFGSTGK